MQPTTPLLDLSNGRNLPGAVLVIGGGVGGMRAALDVAEAGLKAFLVESTPALGGRVAQLGFMFPTHDCVLCRGTSDHGYGCTRPSITPALLDHNLHPNIEVLKGATVSKASGEPGRYAVSVQVNGSVRELTAGAVVQATG